MAIPEELQPLVDLGYALVPASAQKHPLVPWRQWTERAQTPEEQANLPRGDLYAVVTGSLYGLVVLDFDGDGVNLAKGHDLDPNVITGSKGWHVWIGTIEPIKTMAGVEPGLDVRGEGGLAYLWGTSSKGTYNLRETDKYPPTAVPTHWLPVKQDRDVDLSLLSTYEGDGAGLPSALRVLARGCDEIRNAARGTSNSVTCRVAYSIGGLVASGELDPMSAFNALAGAAEERGVGNHYAVIDHQMCSGGAAPWRTCHPTEDGTDLWVPASDLSPDRAAPRLPASPSKRMEVVLEGEVALPLDAFPKEVQALVNEGAPILSAPPQYIAASCLPALATAIGGNVTLGLRKTWRIPPSFYLGLVGPPGASKTPAIMLALKPAFDAHEAIWDNDPKGTARLVLEDTTVERLADLLVANPRGLLFYTDELKSFFSGMGQYKEGGGADRQFYLKAWNGGSVSQNRIKRGDIFIPRANLNVVGGIQPQVFDALTYGEPDGMMERFLLVYSNPVPGAWLDDDVSDETLDSYSKLWNRLRDNGVQERTVPLTAEARRTWGDWYAAFEKDPGLPPHLQYMQPKVRTFVGRTALVLAECDDSSCDSSHIERAVAITEYFIDQADIVHKAADFSPKETKQWVKARDALSLFLEKYRTEHGKNPTRTVLLTKGPNFTRKAKILDEMLAELQEVL